jgi:hypothetical protein
LCSLHMVAPRKLYQAFAYRGKEYAEHGRPA